MSAGRYAAYKHSGVAWLGSIPSHWQIKPIKAVSTCNDDTLPETTDGETEIDYVEISDVQAGQGIVQSSIMSFSEAPSRARRKVRKGDVIISTVRTYLRAIALVRDPPENRIVSTGFAVVRPRVVDASFLGYLCESEYFISEVISRSVGVSYPAINASDLTGIKVPIPGVAEQHAIAAFLDRETGKIDALVEEQRRLIELLKEKRQAVISHAVTRGLDPNAKMKDSGVEWLGQVPAHWKISRVKHVSSHVVDCLHTTPTYGGELEYPAIRTADIERGRLLLDQARLVSREVYLDRIQRLAPLAGDIMYSREGERFGMAALVPEGVELCLGQRMMMFRLKESEDPRYHMWLLNSDAIYQQVLETVVGPTAPHVNISDIINFHIPAPPLKEQQQIGMMVDREINKLDVLIVETVRAESLLLERRAALISAAVTGKIDVRGLAPAEAEAA